MKHLSPSPAAFSCTLCEHRAFRPVRGFTLTELMVTIAILAIMLAVAVPAFDSVALSSKLTSQANDLVATINLARGEAIKRNMTVQLCVSSNGTSCSSGGWEKGWIVLAGSGVLLAHPAAPNGYKLTDSGGLSSLSFQPTGVGASQASITVCRSSPLGGQERVVTLGATGRAFITKTTTGTCS